MYQDCAAGVSFNVAAKCFKGVIKVSLHGLCISACYFETMCTSTKWLHVQTLLDHMTLRVCMKQLFVIIVLHAVQDSIGVHMDVCVHAPEHSVGAGHGATEGITVVLYAHVPIQCLDVLERMCGTDMYQYSAWMVQAKPNKLQLPGDFCSALDLDTREKWAFFSRIEPLFSNCPSAGVRRNSLFHASSASAIDASFCQASLLEGSKSWCDQVLINQVINSAPEVAEHYMGVLAKFAYAGLFTISQRQVLDHFATGSWEPMTHQPLVAETDANLLQNASVIATELLKSLADMRVCFNSRAPM